jgi:2'-hydroxyisoflavone reductase
MNLSRRSILKVPGGLFLGAIAAACQRGESVEARAVSNAAPPSVPPSSNATRPKKVLILGGTAFLGPEVVGPALRRGHTVTLFNRGKTNPHLFPDVEKLHGDRDSDLSALRGRSWDAVVDTSGYVPRIVRKSAEALRESVGQYIFISTISVYDPSNRSTVTEESKVATLADPTTEKVGPETYGALKALCERAVEDTLAGRVTSIRPGLIVGPGDPTDRFTYWPARAARGGEAVAPGTPHDPVQVIDVRDLGEWIVTMIERRDVGVYNAVGPRDVLTIGDMLEACAGAAASDVKFTWVDASFLEAQEVAPWSDMPVWIPPSGSDAGATRIRNSRALEKGLTFRPIAETARDTLAWFRTLPPERQSKLHAGLTAEREAAVLEAWNHRSR